MINYNEKGFSLLELVLAMFIGLLIITGTVAAYLSTKRSYEEVERTARLIQNSRFGMQILSEALIHAGYMGELSPGSIELDTNLAPIAGTNCNGNAAPYITNNFMLAAYSDNHGNVFGCINDAVPGTGAILIKNVRPLKITDSNNDGNVDNPFSISGANTKATYVMANNSRGILFDGMDKAPAITLGGDVPGGSAWQYQFQIYYVRESLSGIPQLSRKRLVWNGNSMALRTEDLIAGVDNMSFLFGLDSNSDGNIDIYRTVTDISAGEWSEIVSIQVSALFRNETEDFQYLNTQEYKLSGLTTIGPFNDHYHRMLMKSTVSLRMLNFVNRGYL